MEPRPELDGKDWQLLEALQLDARLGYAELGRKVRLSAPSVAERVKRLEEAGVISGYRAVVNPKRLGYGISAMIRLRTDGITCSRIGTLVEDIPEVLECRRLAGEDEAGQVGLALVDIELPRKNVALIEAREDRLVVLAAVVAPAKLIDQELLGPGFVTWRMACIRSAIDGPPSGYKTSTERFSFDG